MDFLQSTEYSERDKRTVCEIVSAAEEWNMWKISQADAQELMQTEKTLYRDSGRFFFGKSVMPEIIRKFSSSGYVPDGEPCEFFSELAEIFVYLKNETGDRLSDCGAVDIIYELWEEKSGGSLEMLRSLCEEYPKAVTGDDDDE